MTRIKTLTMVFVALLAMSAAGASSAFAVDPPEDEFEFSGAEGAEWTGEGKNQVFTVNGGAIECKKAKFKGIVPKTKKGKTATVELAEGVGAAYSECTAFTKKAEINVINCSYEFLQPVDLNGEETDTEHEGNVSVVKGKGTAACKIVITVPTGGPCTVTVEPTANANLKKIKYTQPKALTPPLTVQAEVEKITYTSSGGSCGTSGNNGKYKGTVVAKEVFIN